MFESFNPEMQRIHRIVERVAPTDLNVLITGESGVGKEVVAREIASKSFRSKEPFIKINSAAIPSNLMESELFGYQKGAFTGAGSNKRGRIQEAHRGTLFFDEVAELDTRAQGKLLHMLQGGEFTPLGTNEPVTVDVRVLAATNKDVEGEVERRGFREDLFYRLNVIHIHIPPLRERKEDIPGLVNCFLEKHMHNSGNSNPPRINSREYELMRRYHWPGNVRELENFIKNLVLFPDTASCFANLKERIRKCQKRREKPSLIELGRMAGQEVERAVISRILEQNGWHRRKTAEILKISYRSLLGKIRKFEIEPMINNSHKNDSKANYEGRMAL